jgi:hypothetical protein
MNEVQNQHEEFRRCHRGGAAYLLVESVLWFTASMFGAHGHYRISILILVFGGMLIHPLSMGVSRTLKLPALPQSNKLTNLNILIALTIPLGLPLVFMTIRGGDFNLFFPAFCVLIGAHWLPFIYIYRMKSFAVLAGLFVAVGIFFGFVKTVSFATPGFVAAGLLLLFAFLHFRITASEEPAS